MPGGAKEEVPELPLKDDFSRCGNPEGELLEDTHQELPLFPTIL